MPGHIKIGDRTPRAQYATDGRQTAFTFPFPIFRQDDLQVFLDQGPLSGGFTVEGSGESDGGRIVFAVPPEAGRVVTLRRRLTVRRETDFLQGGDMRADSFNDELDQRTAVDQQLDDLLTRALRAPDYDRPARLELPERGVRANKALAFDGDGNLTVRPLGDLGGAPPEFLAAAPGARPRLVEQKLGDDLSVKDFGATGDGLSDDTAAFAAALAAARSIRVPPGTYRTAVTLPLGHGQRLHGAGDASVIECRDQVPVIELRSSYATVQGLRLVGGAIGVRLRGRDGPCVQNALVDLSVWQAGIGLVLDGYEDPDKPCYWNTLQRILIAQPAEHGVLLTRSGAGDSPNSNKFHNVRVYSLSRPITGSGFYVEHGRFMNTFNECEANLSPGAHSCFRVGAGSYKTQILNLYTETLGPVTNVLIEPGADETSVVNLHSASAGPAVADHSTGTTVLINAGWPMKNSLAGTRIAELDAPRATLGAVRYETAFHEGSASIDIDLARRVHLISAWTGPVEARLPAAGPSNGYLVTLKKTDSSPHGVTVKAVDGGSPDGQPLILAQQGHATTVASNGAGWWIIGRNS